MRLLPTRSGRFLATGATAVAMLVTSVAPALARDHGRYGGYDRYHGYGYDRYGYRHRRHDDGLNAGEVIGIAALLGAVVIIASAASKDAKARRAGTDDGYNPNYGDTATDARSEDAAITACAQAARDKASRERGYAEVTEIAPARRSADGWDMDGRVEQRASYRDGMGQSRRFSCSVRAGRVSALVLSRDVI